MIAYFSQFIKDMIKSLKKIMINTFTIINKFK